MVVAVAQPVPVIGYVRPATIITLLLVMNATDVERKDQLSMALMAVVLIAMDPETMTIDPQEGEEEVTEVALRIIGIKISGVIQTEVVVAIEITEITVVEIGIEIEVVEVIEVEEITEAVDRQEIIQETTDALDLTSYTTLKALITIHINIILFAFNCLPKKKTE